MHSIVDAPATAALFSEMTAIVETWKRDLEELKRRILDATQALKRLTREH